MILLLQKFKNSYLSKYLDNLDIVKIKSLKSNYLIFV
ncbi:Uncharacterised protein [Clostridioides difficile]|nr:hypothetical protein CDIF104451_01790 [Clostridioides difficile]SJN61691.1 Uncharacterised protein [Clostridioides difficile]SJN72063.1 Uncharacterised protein [Clostridioides difficile]SJN99593.1 Uncharacterised protein [Clostridioides difficile]SJO15848.1 Uncharacterised protein [Clostridioides difficile]